MIDQHALIAALKNMAIEQDRTPSRDQFCSTIRGGKDLINRLFGNWSAFVQAAGLEPARPAKVTNEIFVVRDIREHLVSYEPPKLLLAEPLPRIMSISDIHWPFEMEAVVDRFIAAVEKNQPEFVIVNGDAFDMYSHAKFPRSHNIFTPADEEKLAREKNEDFWKRVQKAAPGAKHFQMLGNHDVRPVKRVLEVAPTIEHWAKRYMQDLFGFDGVTTIHDERQELLIGSILVQHGFRSKLGEHRDYTRTNCMVGHTHRGGVVFRNAFDIQTNTQRVIWELNSGYAGNPRAKGLSYTPQKIVDWTWGWAETDERGPRFVPA